MPETAAKSLFSYPKFWAHRLLPAPVLPMSRDEMDELGWDSCDVVVVTGDAYVDHPSFGMAIIGRFLESQGFRVGIIAQPDWRNCADFERLGRPNLFFGITAGNMDSIVNRYTADRRIRSRRCVHAGWHGRQTSRPKRDRLLATGTRSVPRRADRDRRHRGEPAADCTLRLLVRTRAAIRAVRCEGRPVGVRQRRTGHRRGRPSTGGSRTDRLDHGRARHRVRSPRTHDDALRNRLDALDAAGSDRCASGPLRDDAARCDARRSKAANSSSRCAGDPLRASLAERCGAGRHRRAPAELRERA